MSDSPSIARKGGRSSAFLINAVLVLVSLAVTLVGAEMVYRLFDPPGKHVAPTADQYKFYVFDPKLGWANESGVDGEMRRNEFAYPVHINQHGMRYREVSLEPAGKAKRIAVVGDSFTWGVGVKDADRFSEIAESTTKGKYEILNFGVSGYGPVQYYLKIDDVIRFKPEIVLILFCLGNDFADNVFWRRSGYYKPYITELSGETLKLRGYPLPKVGEFVSSEIPGIRWLHAHSRLFQDIAGRLSRRGILDHRFSQKGLAGMDQFQRGLYLPVKDSEQLKARELMVAINKQLLSSIKTRLDNNGIDVAVVIAPTKCELGGCFEGETSVNWTARNTLLTTLSSLGIPVIDQSEEFEMSDFWTDDSHWKPSGHRKIARGVVEWLEAELP